MLRVVRKAVLLGTEPSIIPGLCRCGNGDYLVAYNSSGDLGPGQTVGLVRSLDNGVTWGAPEQRFGSVFVAGGIEVGCSLTRLRSGRLLLAYADGFYLHPGPIQEGMDAQRRVLLFCLISDDHGHTWWNQKAQHFPWLEGIPFGRVVEVSGGELVQPVYGAVRTMEDCWCAVMRSVDGGATWDRYVAVARGGEGPICLLPDGRLLMLVRGNNPDDPQALTVCHSADEGRTWSAPRAVGLRGTAPSLHVTADGRVLAGVRALPGSGHCRLASTSDGGLTWVEEAELELPWGEWSYGGYPVLEDLPDGRLLCVFYNGHPPTWRLMLNVLEWG